MLKFLGFKEGMQRPLFYINNRVEEHEPVDSKSSLLK